MIEKVVADSTDDVTRSYYIPSDAVLGTVFEQCVLLWVVEVVLECDSWVEFERWGCCRADVLENEYTISLRRVESCPERNIRSHSVSRPSAEGSVLELIWPAASP